MADFLPAALENARVSLASEKGCVRFDVCTDKERAGEVMLYELYTDRAAFDLHLQSVHFRTFDQFAAPMIESKEVSTYREVVS
jgi:quinol monooxygenase YgiN